VTAVDARERPGPGDAPAAVRRAVDLAAALGPCDVCGLSELVEIRCKVICRNCRSILRSCADL
jgi:hypothetical protein